MAISPVQKIQAPKGLVEIDEISDFIPLISTITNLVALIFKSAVLPFFSKSTILQNRYFTRLDQKSFCRCLMLLIPFIGNLAVALYDASKKKEPSSAIQRDVASPAVPLAVPIDSATAPIARQAPELIFDPATRSDGFLGPILPLPPADRPIDPEKDANLLNVWFDAVKRDRYALESANGPLRDYRPLISFAVGIHPYALRYASPTLKNDPDIVSTAMAVDPFAFQHAGNELKNDYKFVKRHMHIRHIIEGYATESVRRAISDSILAPQLREAFA